MSTTRRAAGPVVLCAVLAVTLLVGAGTFDASHASAAVRVAALERDVRCPDCLDLSVAQSSTEPSMALRREIVASVRAGQSDTEILATITHRYGTSILLLPPPGGLDTVLWAVPTALAVGAGAWLARALLRRRRPT
ncbi:MAG TPA: cytochrome c-type biogenesis protein CcmH [Acidimicrobiales bacterium]|nr:cytochrome c-type biogenesis protein CcmH [Acidimicrobiales bacterium]